MNHPVPATEFSEKFVTMMRNRMLVSFHKYGPLADAYPEKVNALESLQLKLKQFMETGNLALLPDVANYAMIEFMHPRHGKAHLDSNDQSQGRITARGQNEKRNDEIRVG